MRKKKQTPQSTPDRNLVAKHARTFNKAHVFVDRKRQSRVGYRKHKQQGYD